MKTCILKLRQTKLVKRCTRLAEEKIDDFNCDINWKVGYDNKFLFLENLITIVERLKSSSTNKDESSPCEICSLVIGGRGGTREALLLSTFMRTELSCEGVNMVSANPYKLRI